MRRSPSLPSPSPGLALPSERNGIGLLFHIPDFPELDQIQGPVRGKKTPLFFALAHVLQVPPSPKIQCWIIRGNSFYRKGCFVPSRGPLPSGHNIEFGGERGMQYF